MDRDTVISKLKAHFAATGSVSTAYLFGSFARGEQRAKSDVDVAILTKDPAPPTLAGLPLDLEDELGRLLGVTVQVIDLRRAPLDLVHRVLRDGLLLFDQDPSARIAFEVRRRNEYFDLLPILRRYRLQSGAP